MSGVMVGAAIGAVIGGASSISGMRGANKAQIKAYKQQMKALMLNYNYNQNALGRQITSEKDVAIQNLFQLSLNAMNNESMVHASIGESGYEGRNADKVSQVVTGQGLRQKTTVKENFERTASAINAQRDALYIQTKADVNQRKKNLDASLIHGSRAFMKFAGDVAQGAAIGAFTGGAAGSFVSGATATTGLTGESAISGIGLAEEEAALQSATIGATGGTESALAIAPETPWSWTAGFESFDNYFNKWSPRFNTFMTVTDNFKQYGGNRGYY